MGKQDLSGMQTRKMKGLKRERMMDEELDDEATLVDEDVNTAGRAKKSRT